MRIEEMELVDHVWEIKEFIDADGNFVSVQTVCKECHMVKGLYTQDEDCCFKRSLGIKQKD